VLADTQTARFRLRRTRDGQAATDDDAFTWIPRYSTVAGHLPLGDLPLLMVRDRKLSVVRCEIEVIAGGSVAIAVGDTAGLKAWIGTEPLALQPVTSRTLPKGRHRLTLVVDRSVRSGPLSLAIDEAASAKTANARFVTGK
jgi:hypothetical protein